MFQFKHTRIGVDIGATGVRAVQLRRERNRLEVCVVGRSERAVERTEQDGHSLKHRLATCLHAGFRGREVAIGAPSGHTEYHLLELPGAVLAKANRETQQAVCWEIGSLMGEAVDKLQARYWTVPPPSTPGPNALAVGIRNDVVGSAFHACTDAGAVCRTMDVPAAALCRMACFLRPIEERSLWGIIDLGHDQTRLIVCVEDTPVLVRTVGCGGAQWTQRVAESLRISHKAAEVHKCESGIARPTTTATGAEPSAGSSRTELASILYGALRSELVLLATETNRSFQYVGGCYSGRRIREVILVGGGANLKGIDGFLSNQLGLTARRASEFLNEQSCRIQFSSGRGDAFETIALATGLAIST